MYIYKIHVLLWIQLNFRMTILRLPWRVWIQKFFVFLWRIICSQSDGLPTGGGFDFYIRNILPFKQLLDFNTFWHTHLVKKKKKGKYQTYSIITRVIMRVLCFETPQGLWHPTASAYERKELEMGLHNSLTPFSLVLLVTNDFVKRLSKSSKCT